MYWYLQCFALSVRQHDSTVRPLLSTLHQLHNRTINYAALVILELHQAAPESAPAASDDVTSAKGGRHYVQLWLRQNNTAGQMTEEQLPILGICMNCTAYM